MQKGPDFLVGAFEKLNLNLEYYGQTNPEGRTRLTRRLIMDLIRIIIAKSSIARKRGIIIGFDGHPQNRPH
jgi:hypothetical protein